MKTLYLDWLKQYLCFHRKTLQCWWSSACFNGWEAQNIEWGDGTTGEGEPYGQINSNPCILRVYLLQMEGKGIFCFCPLLRTVWWPRGRIGWSCRQIWSSSRLIEATRNYLKPTWSTKRLSWIMSWRAAVNLSNMFQEICWTPSLAFATVRNRICGVVWMTKLNFEIDAWQQSK